MIPMTDAQMHANALSNAADQYAQHAGTVEVGGITLDARKQADSYRRMSAVFRAIDNGVTGEALRDVHRAS